MALRWQWRAASALSAGAGGDADHIARFLSLALPLDLQGQWSALCTHQIAAWRAPISRTGSRLMPTMTATMPKFSRQARVRTFDGPTLPIEHGDALATFARRRRQIHRVHFFGAVSDLARSCRRRSLHTIHRQARSPARHRPAWCASVPDHASARPRAPRYS